MPVILPAEAEAVWLDPTISKEHAFSLLEPNPAELMVALPACTRVNSVRNDDSGLLVPGRRARCLVGAQGRVELALGTLRAENVQVGAV
jgi:hypothetical protein